MNTSNEKIINDALHLPLQARAYLAEKLLESIDSDAEFELSEEWQVELDRRCQEIDSGNAQLISSDDVFSEGFRRLG